MPMLSVNTDGISAVVNENVDIVINSVEATEETSIETDGILFLREEEKLAHDVYVYFAEKYDLRIFNNISKSEQTHMDAMLSLIEEFGLDDPASEEPGKFANADLQKLYNDLITKGNASDEEALKVGALVEETDIADLQTALEETSNESIRLVYENLLRASRNHLRAFNRVLASYGVEYKPEVLSDEYFNEIIDASMEKGYCYGDRDGQGTGNQYQYRNRGTKGQGAYGGGGNGNLNGNGN